MKQTNYISKAVETSLNNEQISIKLFEKQYHSKDKILGFILLDTLDSYFQTGETSQFESVKEDIKKNGVHSPILYINLDGNMIVVDGHMRLKIAKELNLDAIPSLEINEEFKSIDELKVWILKNQAQRRNLDKRIRVRMAYALKDSIAELARKNLVLAGHKGEVENKIDTLAEIAKIADVSRSTIAHFQKVMEKGSEEIKQKMIEGEISINKAYEELNSDSAPSDSPPSTSGFTLKQNYFLISSVKEGTSKMKCGELDCILILPKKKEGLVGETNFKTGLIIIN